MQKIVGRRHRRLLPLPHRNEALVGCFLSLFRPFLLLSSDVTPLLSFFSSGLDRFLPFPSFPVSSLSRGRRRWAGATRRTTAGIPATVGYFFQSCNALWTHAPTSRAVNLRTTRLSLRNMRSGVGVSLVASAPLGAYLLLSIFLCFLCLLSRLDFPSPTLSARPWTS